MHFKNNRYMKVSIFIPCFIDQLFPQTGFNMVKLLEHASCDVVYNENQTCCGQPAFNAGFWHESKSVATKFLQDFDDAEYIVTPSASCTGFIKNHYAQFFENSSLHNTSRQAGDHIFELSQFLVNVIGITKFGASLPVKATYHDSCSGLRDCGIKREPRELLAGVKGLELLELEDAETCCGFGGSFAVKFDEISYAMAEQKIQHAIKTGASHIISTDLSCLMHLQGIIDKKGLDMKTMHLADILTSGW